ncbi:MAG: hypothetical protein SFY92_10215 [Verrucomicrobiae bacterium]|nr:hypothetical protein [Verrucomicrobiae bacterium]
MTPDHIKRAMLGVSALGFFLYLFALRDYLPGTAIHIDKKWEAYGMLSAVQIFWVGFLDWKRLVIWIGFCTVYFYRRPFRQWIAPETDPAALAGVALGMLLYIVGLTGELVKLGMVSLFVTAYSLAWFLIGRSYARTFFIPFLFFFLCFNNLWMEWIGLSTTLKEWALAVAGTMVALLDSRVQVRSLSITIEGFTRPAVSMMSVWQGQGSTSWIPLLISPFLATGFLFWRRVRFTWLMVYIALVPVTGFVTQIIRILMVMIGAILFGEGFVNLFNPLLVPIGFGISFVLECLILFFFWKIWTQAGRPTD